MKKAIPLTLIVALTAACGGGGGSTNETPPTTPTPEPNVDPGETSVTDALLLITGGFRYELTAREPGFIAGEERARINVSRSSNSRGFGSALIFEGTDVIAVAGTDIGDFPNFAVIDGTTVAPTGNATFTGHYSVADDLENLPDADEHGTLTVNYDMGAGTLTGTSDNSVLVVNGTTDGGDIAGSVSIGGGTADLEGGFFGAGATEMSAGFVNEDFGGYIYGTQ